MEKEAISAARVMQALAGGLSRGASPERLTRFLDRADSWKHVARQRVRSSVAGDVGNFSPVGRIPVSMAQPATAAAATRNATVSGKSIAHNGNVYQYDPSVMQRVGGAMGMRPEAVPAVFRTPVAGGANFGVASGVAAQPGATVLAHEMGHVATNPLMQRLNQRIAARLPAGADTSPTAIANSPRSQRVSEYLASRAGREAHGGLSQVLPGMEPRQAFARRIMGANEAYNLSHMNQSLKSVRAGLTGGQVPQVAPALMTPAQRSVNSAMAGWKPPAPASPPPLKPPTLASPTPIKPPAPMPGTPKLGV